ncbi:hypothetical protein Agub_g8999 [Astrephomene gubernaculifera]|uniref:Carboxypeptidase n=1 Tax=Astrephomene gubernaculifera TaxID=47775 RepID=A0AAD3DUI3_9CHLO|nr:hypothetical protein Agub_g8999 [Astrephomene gubernaculifera]
MASGQLALVAVALLAITCSAGGARMRVLPGATVEQPSHHQVAALSPSRNATRGVRPCDNQDDEVCSLPGLAGNPHVRMRSGYITVSEASGRRLWYLLADREAAAPEGEWQGEGEMEGQEGQQQVGRHSDAAPVLLWLTGGPGCSSLDAFVYEHGPFTFSYVERQEEEEAGGDAGSSSTGGGGGEGGNKRRRREVELRPNPYSWTKLATVIYVDSPAGAGMSYSGRPEVDYHTDDAYTIADLVTFLEGLTHRYPELSSAPFFISGESYGGVFVPLLARELLRVNRRRERQGRRALVNLEGYAVGNPVTDDVVDGNAQLVFAAHMGYVDPPSWRDMREACGDMFWNATPGTACWDAQGVVKDDLWDLNWYDVLDPCTRGGHAGEGEEQVEGRAAGRGGRIAADLARRFYWPFTVRMKGAGEEAEEKVEGEKQQQQQEEEGLQAAGGRRRGRQLWGPWLRHTAPCMDRSIALDWLNRADVRTALHAAPASLIGGWQPCSDVLRYALDTAQLVPVHEELVGAGIRALVYSGDHDMVVPHTGTAAWLYGEAGGLGGPEGPLRPWMMGGQIMGFTARFRSGSRLRFASVKGAGHMVPQSRPAQALHLLGAFLYDKEL